MKKQNYRNSIQTYCLVCTLVLSACGTYALEDETEEDSSSKGYQMSLNVRSGDIELERYYPLTVFIFNEEGKLIDKDKLADKDDTYLKTLGKGQYTLTAFSGLSEDIYYIPDEPTTTDYIQYPTDVIMETPLMAGQSRVSLTENTQITLSLSYTMAALSFNLKALPADATSVKVQVSPVSSGMSFTGNYINDQHSYTIDCVQTDEGWETETFYVFPSESSRTNLSIDVERPQGNETYSYTYTDMLQPAQPYRFSGTFQEGISMGGVFEIEGWKPSLNIDFNLNGENTEEDTTGGDEAGLGTETVLRAPQLPIADKIWGYFYVWKVEELSETEVRATLISPDQWYVYAADAPDIIGEYSIDHLDDWRTFTVDEAKEFKKQFAADMSEFNESIYQMGLDRFYANDGARYLCDNCTKTFSFSNNIVKEAGKTVKYYLRGIKTVRVKLDSSL